MVMFLYSTIICGDKLIKATRFNSLLIVTTEMTRDKQRLPALHLVQNIKLKQSNAISIYIAIIVVLKILNIAAFGIKLRN